MWNFYTSIRNEYSRKQRIQDTQRVIEFYNDRVEQISDRLQIKMDYSSIRIVIETKDLLALIDNIGRYIVLRAEDLTPYDAEWIRKFIYPRLRKVVRRYKGEMNGRLTTPLPIPIIETQDEIFMAFPVTIKPEFQKSKSRFVYAMLFLLAVCLLGGTVFTNLIWITKSVIADTFIHMGILLVFEALLFGLFYGIKKAKLKENINNNRYPSGVSFVKRGMAVGFAGSITIIPWKVLEYREKKTEYSFGIKEEKGIWPLFRISREQVPNPDALKDLLKQQNGLR